MGDNHLTYFKVENFKKFESLEVNDIGQFNLIVGDNNVGKTCLLEALLFDEDREKLISYFHMGLKKRGLNFKPSKTPYELNGKIVFDYEFPQGNYFTGLQWNTNNEIRYNIDTKTKKNTKLSILPISIGGDKQLDESSELKVLFTNHIIRINDKTFNIYNYDENILDFPLIGFNDTPLEEETIKIYETLKTKREKEILLNALKVVNNKISGIDFRGNFNNLKSVFLISFENNDEFVPLNFLGDGFKRIFYIVLKAISLKGKRILIDEIEIGIHYSKMKYFWINIMKVCKELDVQLFATTHSAECIENYVEASKEIDEQNIRLIKLQEKKDKSIKAICYPYNEFEDVAASNTENR